MVAFLLGVSPEYRKKQENWRVEAGAAGARVSHANKQLKSDELILKLLRRKPRTSTALAKPAGYKNERSIRRKLESMEARGLIVRGDKRIWRECE